MMEWALRRIDRNLGEVRSAKAFHLCIQIGKVPTLQQRVVAEVHSRNNVVGTEGDLFRFSKEIIDTAIQHKAAYSPNRNLFFRNEFRGIQNVEFKSFCKLFVKELKSEFPFGKVAGLNCIPQVPAVEVRV